MHKNKADAIASALLFIKDMFVLLIPEGKGRIAEIVHLAVGVLECLQIAVLGFFEVQRTEIDGFQLFIGQKHLEVPLAHLQLVYKIFHR